MRIASYNIMSGGFNSYNRDSPFPERLDILKKAIKLINADFIGLVDTHWWDEIYTNEQISEMFGYKSAHCINLNDDRLKGIGHNNGITVLTNENVESVETINLKTRDALKTRVKTNGKLLDIYTTYLDDLSEDTRVEQVNSLLENIDSNTPSIIMGDLNTFKKADLEFLTPLIDEFFTNNPKLLDEYQKIMDDMKRGEVIDLLEKNGFKDGSSDPKPTGPTKLFPIPIKEPILRLDYAFQANGVGISNFEVKTDPIFDEASDHFPIVFECNIQL